MSTDTSVADVPRTSRSSRGGDDRGDRSTPTQRRQHGPRPAVRTVDVLKWVYLGVGVVFALVPFIWMVSGSFRSESDLFHNPASLFPTSITMHGYVGVWQQLSFVRLLVNTFVFAGVTTALTLLFDSMCAYALARMRFVGRNVAFVIVIATLMVPFQVTLIPVFVELFHFGWLNTYQGLIVPRATSAFGIFLFRQFFVSIPPELDEAARIDGAGHWRIYWQVVLPLAKPAIATVAVLNGMNLWNDLLWPLVVTTSNDMLTLPAGLTLFGGQHVTDHAILLAGATISLVPIAIAFFFAQKYFVAGVATSGLK
ncbi:MULTISPECIES: carbohydrate ABC transporter permease [unclassified Curtobacterium]|uniref:carbohydrate ABC transporter permease n=1 Tax=unclassified Curtobacterium TaxID=257496 RepID=UPI000DA8FAFB|nr:MULTISPECIES: carbohydrate ABC transporter permease [unclassified Curtobacterium]PZE26027.1 carbohydrate ABC transporter permease [Curtobacterium sp. MCBD17_028]PZE77768.1 carbohydrate ABC transporter permease [Curtobacterium sp. MCBD17_019]WIB67493.1 carbohydrate ABC transporter permease [Curtobacterium sp. MCBD17_035]